MTIEALIFDLKAKPSIKAESSPQKSMKGNKSFSDILESLDEDKVQSSKDKTKEKGNDKEIKTNTNPNISKKDDAEDGPKDIEQEDTQVTEESEMAYEGVFNLFRDIAYFSQEDKDSDETEPIEMDSREDKISSNLHILDRETDDPLEIYQSQYPEEQSTGDVKGHEPVADFIAKEEVNRDNEDIVNLKTGHKSVVEGLKKENTIDENPRQDQETIEEDTFNLVRLSEEEDVFNRNPQEKEKKSLDSKEEQKLSYEKSPKEDSKVNSQNVFHLTKDNSNFTTNHINELDRVETVDREEILEKMVSEVKYAVQDSKNEIRIKLKPESLGEMAMNIEVVKGEITAKVMVDNYKTKDIIEGNLLQFKEQIKETGLEIKTFEVFVGNNGDFDKHNSKQFNFNKGNKKMKLKAQGSRTTLNYDKQLESDPLLGNQQVIGSLDLLA
ncbi:MAG: flagellar hook-length control protein FliK [Tissierellaceae bacterium]